MLLIQKWTNIKQTWFVFSAHGICKGLEYVYCSAACKHLFLVRFQLQSLLLNSHAVLSVPITSKKFCEFNPESKYSLDGRLGIQMMRELMDASLSASDSVTISSKLGTIEEKGLDSDALLQTLQSRYLSIVVVRLFSAKHFVHWLYYYLNTNTVFCMACWYFFIVLARS